MILKESKQLNQEFAYANSNKKKNLLYNTIQRIHLKNHSKFI